MRRDVVWEAETGNYRGRGNCREEGKVGGEEIWGCWKERGGKREGREDVKTAVV